MYFPISFADSSFVIKSARDEQDEAVDRLEDADPACEVAAKSEGRRGTVEGVNEQRKKKGIAVCDGVKELMMIDIGPADGCRLTSPTTTKSWIKEKRPGENRGTFLTRKWRDIVKTYPRNCKQGEPTKSESTPLMANLNSNIGNMQSVRHFKPWKD